MTVFESLSRLEMAREVRAEASLLNMITHGMICPHASPIPLASVPELKSDNQR